LDIEAKPALRAGGNSMRSQLFQLDDRLWFPDPRNALRGQLSGLVAVGGDLTVARLLLAYRSGIFPWTDAPITWWSPDPRAIFELDGFHVSHSLEKILRKGIFTTTINQAFTQVMEGCARPGERGQWITPAFIAAYTRLHQAGHAHSLECWRHGELAGGIYGVAAGGLFAGESMFYRVSNASKAALYHLMRRLHQRGFALFDIQMLTPITEHLGATLIARAEYLRRLKSAVELPCQFV
jgi:leucyl/phenylalanyl-tRNA--protein transferase